jgi:hypothetical protein
MNAIINSYTTKIEDLGADKLNGGDMEFGYVLRIFIDKKVDKKKAVYQSYTIKRDIDRLIDDYFSKKELEESKD